ncbi:gamma-glutamylcyclotransferase family protein [Vibrio ostreicida]|uniref:Gamma-glutamylcyclotransferase family protein n=1 Tax=Vibrio ostreicida TaxID=526588 RepID=A0ABT8BQC8_9VIBR|nr:gamma-glutamylcyclotransferase [Vibrio ostreicida]MDN3608318.1 gamma-glutamylcyclotransferase [Vibrio ostreicida]NPD09698.1 gamma-glutamylcyclotransferase [Vibrio ostreicida]
MQHLLFVYGTLRQGEIHHDYLAGTQCLGHFETPPHFSLYELGSYPAVVEGHSSILGEVYLIDDETLSLIDKLEDVPVEYRREQIETSFGIAWIYLYQDSSQLETMIASGDWCQRV